MHLIFIGLAPFVGPVENSVEDICNETIYLVLETVVTILDYGLKFK